MLDATGNPAIIGNHYGYTQSNNGIITIITGKCRDIKNGKLTLEQIRETTYHSGHHYKTIHTERARSVYSHTCFPIDINNLKHH